MKHFHYAALLRDRTLVAALTLGLVVVMVGMGIELIVNSERSTIAAPTQKLIAPLDPQLDVKTVERLESYKSVGLDEAKRFLRERLTVAATPLPTPTPEPTEVPLPSIPPEAVPQDGIVGPAQ